VTKQVSRRCVLLVGLVRLFGRLTGLLSGILDRVTSLFGSILDLADHTLALTLYLVRRALIRARVLHLFLFVLLSSLHAPCGQCSGVLAGKGGYDRHHGRG
jgi:hypothetical protein